MLLLPLNSPVSAFTGSRRALATLSVAVCPPASGGELPQPPAEPEASLGCPGETLVTDRVGRAMSRALPTVKSSLSPPQVWP